MSVQVGDVDSSTQDIYHFPEKCCADPDLIEKVINVVQTKKHKQAPNFWV